MNPSAPADLLRELARDEDEDVRRAAAGNPSAPEDALRRLARDEDARYGVAWNRSAPIDLLRELARDEDEGVRRAVARNRLAPEDALRRLARDKSETVRRVVASNPRTFRGKTVSAKARPFDSSW